jgi:PAS domain S-box-containing protein
MQALPADTAGTTDGLLPHAACYLWDRPLVLTHLVSDALAAASYLVIATALAVLVLRARRELPFNPFFVAFALFFVAGALTHFMNAWTLWTPAHWLAGGVKAVTALASVATATAMPFLIPRVHTTIRAVRFARERDVAAVRTAALEEQNRLLAAHAAELQRERAEAGRHLDELEATYRSAPVGLCVLDTDLRFVRINEHLAQMNGLPPEAHVGRTIREVVPDVAAKAEPTLRRILDTGEPVIGVEIRGETPAEPGVEHCWIESWHPLRDRTGAIVGINVVAEDVTERHRAEAKLARTVEEVRRANAQLERVTEDLRFTNDELATANAEASAARIMAEQASAAKSAFLATMSHELRTPLNAVLGYVELLTLGVVGDVTTAQRGYLDRVTASAKHLLGLINEVLDLTKVEAGQMSVELQPTAVPEQVRQALTLVRPQAESRQLQVYVDGGRASELTALADPGRVRQILVNLLGNAVRFTAPGGRITLRLARVSRADGAVPPLLLGDGQWVRIDVHDTGVGIPAHRLEAVFDPFVQVAGATDNVYTRQHGGTGLGLTIARRLARLMGGELTGESTEGVGSTFTLWLAAVATGVAGADRVARSEVGRVLSAYAVAIVAEVAERMRADPLIPAAREAAQVDLEVHMTAFLAELGQELTILDAPTGDRAQLLADGFAVQRLLVEKHGRLRARLGWDAAALRQEFVLLQEEVERAVRTHARSHPDTPLDDLLSLVRALVDEAGRIALETLAAGASADAVRGG